MECPISSAEKRLVDASEFWKRAHNSYFEPDEFRLNVQSSIQAFRTVTFLLQKMKGSISGFDPWYSKAQELMRDDKKLRWLVEARNKIEKQGDLETHSSFSVEYSASWESSEKRIFELPPTTRPEQIAETIAASYPQSKCTEAAILKLSREWVDSEMPGEEILTLLVHAYSRLHKFLIQAHQLIELDTREVCAFYLTHVHSNQHMPDWMSGVQFPAVSWFSLEQGTLKEFEMKNKTVTLDEAAKIAEERYNNFKGIENSLTPTSSFVELCENFFARGKQMLKKDGYHSMIAMIFTDSGFYPIELRPSDRADKHILIRELASRCARLRAVSCILIGEVWMAPLSTNHGPYAVNHPERKEALSLGGFHRDEGFVDRFSIFERHGTEIKFEDDREFKQIAPATVTQNDILKPVADSIKKVWAI